MLHKHSRKYNTVGASNALREHLELGVIANKETVFCLNFKLSGK